MHKVIPRTFSISASAFFAEVLGIAFDVNQKCADRVCSGASESEKYFSLVICILGQAHGSEISL